MNADAAFVDSNVFLYLLDRDMTKKQIAEIILLSRPVISPQVIFENLNVAIRRFSLAKIKAIEHAEKLLEKCVLFIDTDAVLYKALELMRKDTLSTYDSHIVASALEAGCTELYSEDLQHLRVFEGRLTIINPFIAELR